MTRRGWAPYVAVAAFVLATAIIGLRIVRELETAEDQPEVLRHGMQDFRDAVYNPVRTLLDGGNPYSPSEVRRRYAGVGIFPLMSPLTLLVHLPFGVLPRRVAQGLDFGVNILVIVLLAWLSLRWCEIRPTVTNVAGVAAALVISRPGHSNLFAGQCSAYMAAATLAALHYGWTRPVLAAWCLALATVKPTFGAPLAVLLLASGAVRASVLGGVLALVGAAIPGWFVVRAAGGVVPFMASVRENLALWSTLPETSGRMGVFAVDAVAILERVSEVPPAVAALISAVILGLGALAMARLGARAIARPGALAIARHRATLLATCVGALTVLIVTHHQIYDALLLVLPLTALVTGRLPMPAGARGSALRLALIGLLIVPFVNYFGSYHAIVWLGLEGAARLAVVSATGIALLLVWIALVTLALAAPRDAAAPSRPAQALR